jgi:hypothetical protein
MKIFKPFRELKRIVSQFIETEYWYRFRKIPYSYFDDYGSDATSKYIWKHNRARDILTCTWDGEGDIMQMMLLKIEHQFHNLKHYGVQADFYFDSHNIVEYGTREDKLWAFNKIIEENKFENVKPKDRRYNFHYIEDNKISFVLDGKKELVLELNPNAVEPNSYFWYITEKGKEEIKNISNCNEIEDWVIDTVICNEHTVHIKVEEYKNLSDGLKPYARGNRRTLTQLLHLRHLIKKLYALEDTNDEYMNMWQNEEDEDKRQVLLKQSMEKFMEDRKRLYHEIAEFMAEEGRGWWD